MAEFCHNAKRLSISGATCHRSFNLTRNKIWISPGIRGPHCVCLSSSSPTLPLSSVLQNWQPSISRLFYYLWSPKAFPLCSEDFSVFFTVLWSSRSPAKCYLPGRSYMHVPPHPHSRAPAHQLLLIPYPNTHHISQHLKSYYFLIESHFLGQENLWSFCTDLHSAGVMDTLHHTSFKLAILKFSTVWVLYLNKLALGNICQMT